MKMLYLTLRDFPRRVANRVQTMKMAEAFSRYCDVVLCVSKLHVEASDLWEYYGIRSPFRIEVLGEPVLRPRTLFAFPSILKCVRRHRPDYIYVREEYVGWVMSFLFGKYIYEMLDYQTRFARLYPRLVRSSVKTVVISEGLRKRAIESGLPSEKLVVCPDGVDLEAFDIRLDKTEARRKVGLSEQGKFVLYSGRFSPWKGVSTLVESAQYLRADSTCFVLLGGFEGEAESLQKHIDRLGVRDRVTILGHKEHSQIPLYLKAADVLVIPNSRVSELSIYYTSPLKLFEYMAAQRPIVASDLPAIREVVDQESAIMVPPDDPEKLAEGIKRALNGGPEVQQKINAAYQRVDRYSWNNRARQILFGKQA